LSRNSKQFAASKRINQQYTMVKLAKASKQATPKKKAPPPPKEEESSEEESSEEEEEEAPPVKKAAPAPVKAVKNGKAAKKPESEEEEDDDDDSEEEESEEEAPPPKPAAKATPAKAAKAPPPKAEESDDDDDDDEEESEEEAPPPVKGKAKPAAKVPVKAAPKEESEDDDDDEDDDEDESEEEMDTTPAAPAKKAGMVKAKEESEEEEDDDEEDDDEEEEEDEEEEAPVAPAKRKADAKKETPPAKKAKADGDGFCLFVGNLNPNKEYDEIKDALRKFFTKNELEIADVRLGGSKRFGYVEFSSEEDLDKALELNGKKVLGFEMKLDKAKSKENSQAQKSERDAKTLFVKNLPFAATSDDLKEIFDDAVDIRLPMGQNGANRGIAYIEFKSEEQAEKYLEQAQGADVQGRSILVDFVGSKSQQNKQGGRAAAAGAPCKTLMVNNVAFSATEDVLQQSFEKAVSIRIPQNNGRSKGFAFVEFENEEDAKEAMETVNNTDIEGRTVRIEYSQQMGNRRESGGQGFNSGPTKTLFVKGLSEDTSDETLRDSFEGAVGARIVTDRETGSSKGFGFVDFDSETDCQAAKEAMEEGEIDGRRVTLDYAKPKGEGGFRGGRGGGGFGGGGFRGGRGGGGFGGGRGGRGGGFGGGRGGGFRGGRGGGGRGGGRGFGGGRGGGGGFSKPQGKKIKFDD